MGIEPPVSRTVPLPFIPGERLVDLGERLNRYLGGSADEPWTTYAVKHDDEIAGLWHRLTTFAIPGEQSPEEGQAICGLSGTTPPIGKSRRFFPGLTRSPRDHLWMNLRVENVSVQTALSTDRRLAIRGSFHS
jgi:hypothetical protein